MARLLAYPLTVLHLVVFFLLLVIFHPIQLIAHKIGGHDPHQKTVATLNWFLMQSQLFLGTRYSMVYEEVLPLGKSYIFVSNHQSMFDIPPLIYYLRRHFPKFISKIELAKGIPSISLNLRIGENAAIDRKDPRQSISVLTEFAKNAHAKKRSVVIFAEGTRSRTGVPKPFQRRGLLTLFKYMPDAEVVPITINNSWKVDRYGKFPYGIGNHITVHIHKPLPLQEFSDKEELIDRAQLVVHSTVTETAVPYDAPQNITP